MRAIILAALLVSGIALAEEQPATEAVDSPVLNLKELFQKPEISLRPKAKKKAPAVAKGASYLLTYQGEDDQWYETEVVATGRSAVYCDGVRYEVDAGDFTYFAKPKELRRIRGCR